MHSTRRHRFRTPDSERMAAPAGLAQPEAPRGFEEIEARRKRPLRLGAGLDEGGECAFPWASRDHHSVVRQGQFG